MFTDSAFMLVSWYTLMWFSQHLNDMNIRKWPVPSIHVNFAEKKSAYYIWNVTRYECLMFCMQDFTTSFTRLFDKLEKKEVIWSSSQNAWCSFRPDGTLPVPEGPTAQESGPSNGHACPHPQNPTLHRPHPHQQVPGLDIHRPHCQEGEISII